MRKFTLASATLLVLFVCCVYGIAQESGIPTFGASDNHGIDTINLMTLTPVLNVPILSKSGAIPFSTTMSAAQSCAIVGSSSSSGGAWQCALANGTSTYFVLAGPSTLGYTVQATESTYSSPCGGYVLSSFVVFSADGLSGHPLAPSESIYPCNGATSFVATTIDGSGLTASVSNCTPKLNPTSCTVSITSPSGIVSTPGNGGASEYKVVDPHNNSITSILSDTTNITTYTDTLNTAALEWLPLSGNTERSYQWTDTQGNPKSITLTLGASLTLSSNFPSCPVAGKSASQELGPVGWINSINYPDGTAIPITMETGPGGSGTTTGRIGSFKLRTGGTVSYGYGTLNCNGIPATLTRTTQDGTTTYSTSTSGIVTTTTVLDPGNNKTIYTFTNVVNTDYPGLPPSTNVSALTEIQRYQNTGTVASPAYLLLSTDLICYNGNASNCSNASTSYPITERDTYHTIGSMATSSRVQETFDGYGNTTSVSRYGFGASQYTTRTNTIYVNGSGSTCAAVTGINNLPCLTVTYSYGSNNSVYTTSAVQNTYNSLGFLTASSRWAGNNTYPNGTWLTTSFTPNSNGTVATATDPNGTVTTYAHADCNGVLPTSAAAGGLTSSATWDCNGGVQLTTTDPNQNGTATTYDSMFQPNSYTDLSNFTTSANYNPFSSAGDANVNVANSFSSSAGTSVYNSYTYVDGLGRPVQTQKQQGPGSGSWDAATTSYQFVGPNRVITSSTPCTVTALGSSCPSTYNTTQTIDPLGRPGYRVDPNGGTISYVYNGQDTSVTIGPKPSGENLKTTQTEVDGLGRVVSTCTLLSTGGTGCGQVMGGSGILTSYAYDFGPGISKVTATRGVQSRTTVYDAVGRVISTSTPEAGTTTYTYDSVPSPGVCNGWTSQPGQLMLVGRADGSSICYVHNDPLGRLTRTCGTTGTCQAFRYDNSQGVTGTMPSGITVNNTLGRLVEAETDNGTAWPPTSQSMLTDEWFSYDNNGRLTDVWELTPHSAGYYHSSASYYPNGVLASLSVGGNNYGYAVDGEGRPYDASLNYAWIIQSTTYDAGSRPLVSTDGNGETDVYTYDVLGHMTSYTLNGYQLHQTGTLGWNANGSLASLNVMDQFTSDGTQQCTFSYDDAARLITDNCANAGTAVWNQTYSYDQYDNLTKTGNPGTSWLPRYTNNNQYQTIGATYDGAGRLTYDSNYTYTWDAYGKMTSVTPGNQAPNCGVNGAVCVTYDAFGRKAEIESSGPFYGAVIQSPVGEAGVFATNGTGNQFYIPLPGGRTGGMNPSINGVYVAHKDWLGTTRLWSSLNNDNGADSFIYDRAVSPYGETYVSTCPRPVQGVQTGPCPIAPDFTGDLQDFSPGLQGLGGGGGYLYDTPNREYSIVGRWLSPDPAGSGWNAYAYPTDPNTMTDPSGLDPACMFDAGCSNSVDGSLGYNSVSAGCISIDGGGACAQLIGNIFNYLETPFVPAGAIQVDGGCFGCSSAASLLTAYNSAANSIAQKQLNTLKSCVNKLYNVNMRTFVPVAPGSNGYFFGLTANGTGISVETNVTHSSWTLGLMSLRPWPVGGLTYGSTAPNQLNYVASDVVALGAPGIEPNQVHELAHALDNITFGTSSEASADALVNCTISHDE